MLPKVASVAGQPNKTLFVGCMDPQTNEDDLLHYFGAYDQFLQVKLLWNIQTNTSKQCALLFCSSFESALEILKYEHKLHDRHLRVKFADDDRKGTKTPQLFYLQVSGIPVNTPDQEVEKAFAQYPDYHSFRFIQGTHQKQKWVAKVAFQNQASMKNLLAAQNHVAIGQKLCKIAEFQPKGSSSATSEIQSAYSTTKSSYGEDEPARAIGRLDKFKFPNHQFFSPFSSPDLYDDHPNYPQTNSQSYSSQDLAYKTYLHKSDPNDFPKKLPTHLSLSSPAGDHGLRPIAPFKAQHPVQILLSDLDNDDDGNLFQLFTGDGKHKKSS